MMDKKKMFTLIPIALLALSASYGIYSFSLLFVPWYVAAITALAFELTYCSLVFIDSKKAKPVSVMAVVVSVLWNVFHSLFVLYPESINLFVSNLWLTVVLAFVHGVPLATLAYLVADVSLHTVEHEVESLHPNVEHGVKSLHTVEHDKKPGVTNSRTVEHSEEHDVESLHTVRHDEKPEVESLHPYGKSLHPVENGVENGVESLHPNVTPDGKSFHPVENGVESLHPSVAPGVEHGYTSKRNFNIKTEYENGAKVSQLAKKYNVSKSTIYKIVKT